MSNVCIYTINILIHALYSVFMLLYVFFRKQVYDPEDPRCARLTLTGKMVEVEPEELDFAREAMFSR